TDLPAGQRHGPLLGARGAVEASQVAVGAKHVDEVSVNRRRAAGAATEVVFVVVAHDGRPDLLTRVDVDRQQKFILFIRSQHVEAVADNGRARVTDPRVLEGPDQLGAGLWPGLE